MNYTFEINSENKMIRVVTTGDLIKESVASMGLEIMLKAKMLKYNILFDYRLSKNRISIVDAYRWYSDYYDNIDINFRFIPIAYIANDEDWTFYSFFECTCNNNLIPVRVFQEESAALKWIESL
jgi:hypothetical protein